MSRSSSHHPLSPRQSVHLLAQEHPDDEQRPFYTPVYHETADRAAGVSAKILNEPLLETLLPGMAYFIPLTERDCLSDWIRQSVLQHTRGILWDITAHKNSQTLKAACLRAYAEIALSIWPHWYQHPSTQTHKNGIHFSKTWFNLANQKCEHGFLPLVKKTTLAVNAEQLSLALSTVKTVHFWNVLDDGSQTHRSDSHQLIRSLSLLAEWWSRTTHSTVCLIANPKWRNTSAIDHIAYHQLDPNALWIKPTTQHIKHPDPSRSDPKASPLTSNPPSIVEPVSTDPEVPLKTFPHHASMTPLIGVPHPLSPGEQLLFKTLEDDPSTRGLFKPNMRVQTRWGQHYIVDLLCAEHHAVIEIDGFSTHNSAQQFRLDRQRDYELTVTGFCVIRFCHNTVMSDVQGVKEKIQIFINYLQSRSVNRAI
ncbi:MAG: DUF559 domain-containing protein [Gammaproteobacteria bacterium]